MNADQIRERDAVELCRRLCTVEREAVLMQMEAEEPDLAARIREVLALRAERE